MNATCNARHRTILCKIHKTAYTNRRGRAQSCRDTLICQGIKGQWPPNRHQSKHVRSRLVPPICNLDLELSPKGDPERQQAPIWAWDPQVLRSSLSKAGLAASKQNRDHFAPNRALGRYRRETAPKGAHFAAGPNIKATRHASTDGGRGPFLALAGR